MLNDVHIMYYIVNTASIVTVVCIGVGMNGVQNSLYFPSFMFYVQQYLCHSLIFLKSLWLI